MSDSVTVSAADVAVAGGLAYRRAGSGEPVVLLHPLALAGDAWGEFADRLATRADVIAVDARGHGRSAWDGGPFTIEDLADDVGALLDEAVAASAITCSRPGADPPYSRELAGG